MQLIQAAQNAISRAYAPYSKFRVGAAVLTADGRIFSGCNVENASYGLTICAERVAICTAVAAGATQIESCAIITDQDVPVYPCGACCQFLSEFNPRTKLYLLTKAGAVLETNLIDVFTKPFNLADFPKR